MKYGICRKLYAYNFDLEAGAEIVTRPSDFHRAIRHCEQLRIEDGYKKDFAWGWFALNRAGKLEELGLPDKLTAETIDEALDSVSMQFEEIKDDELPLKVAGQNK